MTVRASRAAVDELHSDLQSVPEMRAAERDDAGKQRGVHRTGWHGLDSGGPRRTGLVPELPKVMPCQHLAPMGVRPICRLGRRRAAGAHLGDVGDRTLADHCFRLSRVQSPES